MHSKASKNIHTLKQKPFHSISAFDRRTDQKHISHSHERFMIAISSVCYDIKIWEGDLLTHLFKSNLILP